MADEKQTSAIFKRHEQLKRWEESDTNKCPGQPVYDSRKVKFQDGCIFLAACSSGDREEVKRLLDRGADINTANIDGLTALHQACIDDNLDMVEFLVENGADVDVCDNEGWTPLHATASCGFSEIARYLLRTSCNVAAVNNDGDLPYDICEDDEMERLLQEAMDEQGVDAEAARKEEENLMLADANQWLNNPDRTELAHPKTGATPLHIAAAKGYITVMNVLLQGNSDINFKDNDGWTPLHAAAHWGQEEACKVLAGAMCDMEAKNLAGQTAFDVADSELIKLLEELKLKQASLKDQQKDLEKDIIQTKVPASRRSRNDPARSSVTRMSVEQKHNVMKTVEPERLDARITPTKEEEKVKSSSSSCSDEEETSESETEQKKNEINKQTSGLNQPRDRDKPPIMATVEIKEKDKPEMPKIEESVETSEKENLKKLVDKDKDLTNDIEVIGDGLKKDKILNNDKTEIKKEEEEREKEIIKTDIDEEKEKEKEKDKKEKNEEEKKEKEISDEKKTESNKDISKDISKEKDLKLDKDDKPLIEDNVPLKTDKEGLKRTISAPSSVTEDKPGRRPLYSSSSFSTADHNSSNLPDRSYEPPKRDEETEMLRKVRAKRARETRRSTQGVTLEDVQQANEALKKSDDPSALSGSTTATTTTTTLADRSSRSSDDKKSQDTTSDITSSSLGNKLDRDNRLSGDVNLRRTQSSNESDLSIPSWRRSREVREENSKKEDDTSRSSSFRRSRVDKDLTSSAPTSNFYSQDSTYIPRSQRGDRTERNALSVADIGNSSLGGSTNLTRSTSLRTDRVRGTDDTSSRIELRREKEKEREKEQKELEKAEEKRPESAAIRSRRMRRERRSTGIANYSAENEDEDKDKENKEDDSRTGSDRTDGDEKSSRVGRYGSASDVPSHLSSRPSSYSEYSRSSTSLEKDYKKLYEDEKYQKEQLKRDLEQCKKELREAKAELDRQVRRQEASRLSDTNDKREKRALERKMSELEEEIKKMDMLKEDNRRLREENGALIRVISKLSK